MARQNYLNSKILTSRGLRSHSPMYNNQGGQLIKFQMIKIKNLQQMFLKIYGLIPKN